MKVNKQNLTKRELEILQLVVKGLRSSEIAARLELSKRTVEIHKSHIYAKYKVRSTHQLLSYLLESIPFTNFPSPSAMKQLHG